MCTKSEPSEWDQLVTKVGLLTLAMGLLEAAIMTMHCKATDISEAELKSRANADQRKGLKKAVEGLAWTDDQKADLAKRLSEVATLDKRRHDFIHLAAARVSDNSIPGVPAGSVINLRTYGIGVMESDANSWTIGVVGKKINLAEIDQLIDDIHQARVGLGPYMDLVDNIAHRPRSLEELVDRLRGGKGTLLS